MKVFYKIWLTGKNNESDILTFAFVTDSGHKLYAELTDYSQDKIDEWTDKHIVSEMLGQSGFKETISEIPRSAFIEGSVDYCRDKLTSFLAKHPFIELVGDPNYWEIQALLWLLSWENKTRHINIISMADKIKDKYSGLFDNVREELPQYNALRMALVYKHIAAKIERDANRK